MNSNVTIKSFTNGLKVFMDSKVDFNSIVEEIKSKIGDSKGFFKGAKIAVSFEGRDISFEEERLLMDTMEDAGEMTILYSIGKGFDSSESVARVVNRSLNDDSGSNCFGKLYTGSLKKGERLETENGIVLLGDIEPGATLISGGSIVVLGGIYGTAVCEAEDEKRHFIAAGNLSAERIRIGKYHLFTKEKPRWVIKPKMQAKICYCEDEQVVVAPVSTESLRKLCEKICGE